MLTLDVNHLWMSKGLIFPIMQCAAITRSMMMIQVSNKVYVPLISQFQHGGVQKLTKNHQVAQEGFSLSGGGSN